MNLSLETLDPNAPLEDHLTALRQTEELGYELISLAVGEISGAAANLAVFRRRPPGSPPSELTLETVDKARNRVAQEGLLNDGETGGGRRLFAYASIWAGGRPVNVAAYRAVTAAGPS